MPKHINLKKIIEGCRAKNPKSQKILYEHFFGYAMNICLLYSKNREEAEEVMHNAFMKIFNGLDKYNMDLNFRPWFRRILINAAIDYYRSNQKYKPHLTVEYIDEYEGKAIPNPVISPEEDVLPIIQKLPPAYRMAFNLYVMEGYKHREIAAKLNISESTSKSNLKRGKAKIKKMILEEGHKALAISY